MIGERSLEPETGSFSSLPFFEIDCVQDGPSGLTLLKDALTQNHPFSVVFLDEDFSSEWSLAETIENYWKVAPTLQCVLCLDHSNLQRYESILSGFMQREQLLILHKPFKRHRHSANGRLFSAQVVLI